MTFRAQQRPGLFGQGAFMINPDATPEELKRKREALDSGSYGDAQFLGEGFADLFKGIVAGRQRKQMDDIERKGREGANSTMEKITSMMNGTPYTQTSAPTTSPGNFTILGMKPQTEEEEIAADTMAALGKDSSDRDLLAKTLMAEAGGEGLDGMVAAGAVMRNRMNAGGYGDTLHDVIMKPGQFSAWNGVTGYAGGEGALDMANMTPSEQAYQAADMILSGNYEDPTGGSTHYYNPAAADPKWGMRAGGDWRRIGNHVFGNADAGRGGQPTTSQPVPQAPQMDMATLYEALANPWLSAAQKSLVSNVIAQQQQANDPIRQLQMQNLQSQINARNNPQGYRVLTPAEVKAAGLPEGGAYQISPKGQITTVGGAKTNVTVNNGSESSHWGEPPKDHVWLRNEAGDVITETDPSGRGVRPVSVPISGGPEDTTPQDAIAQQNRERSGDVVIEDIDRVLSMTTDGGLPTAGGVGNLLSRVPGTDAHNVSKLLQTIRANVGFDRLQQMRDASKTGGALGAINQTEMELLNSALGSLEQSQSKEQFMFNLQRLRNIYTEIVHGPGAGGSDGRGFEFPDVSQMASSDIAKLMEERPSVDWTEEQRKMVARRLRELRSIQ